MAAVAIVKVLYSFSQDWFFSVCGADHRNLLGVVCARASDPGADCESYLPFRASGCGADPGTAANCRKPWRFLRVLDDPVIMQLQLQESKVRCLRFSSSTEFWLAVVPQRWVPTVQTVQKKRRDSTGAVRGGRRCEHAATSFSSSR